MSDMPTRLLSKNNAFGQIPSDPPKKFNPKEVIHVVLTMSFSRSGDLELNLLQPAGSPFPYKDTAHLEAYVKKAAKDPLIVLQPGFLDTQYDISIGNQCWIILQLDPKIPNWQFSVDDYGCTTKKAKNTRNYYLRHAYPGRLGDPGEPVDSDGCKVLYFAVVRRGRKSSSTGSELFNFHTEFVQKSLGARLPVIFDPDIKNDSDTNTIPPGE